MPPKINIQEHLDDADLDLSMLNLSEVPVKDIAAFPKATSLDLSNNCLITLGKAFAPSLTHLVKLDLAQNQLASLPDNFGLLLNLKHLDLYNNQLSSLPLSIGNLKQLKWLDLKQNPLLPKLAQIVGPCLDSSQCASAAKNVVDLLSLMNKQVEEEKKRRKEQMDLEVYVQYLTPHIEDEEKKSLILKKEQLQQTQAKKKTKKKKAKDQTTGLENGCAKDEGLKEEDRGPAGDFDPNTENSEGKAESSEVESTVTEDKPARRNRICAFFGFLFTVIILTICIVWFGIFILSLLDENYYNSAVNHLAKVQRHVTSQLPKPWVKKMNRMFVMCSKSVTRLINRMLKFGVSAVQNIQEWHTWVNTDDTVQTYLDTVKNVWLVLWIRISEMYRTIFV